MPLGSPQGGAEILLQNLLSADVLSFRYTLAFLENGPLVEYARGLGYDVEVFPATRLRAVGNYVKTVASLRSWIRRKQLSAVLSWMPKAHLYVAFARPFLGVKAMWFQHGVPHAGDRMDNLITMLPTDAILCCSEASMEGQGQVFPRRELHVCYPGVRLAGEAVSREEARRRLALEPDGYIIAMIARLERWKGAHIFVEAAAKLQAQYPGTRWFLVGGAHAHDARYAAELGERIKALGLGERLTLVGQRPAAEVRLWQRAADVIVQPTTGAEPFGMAIVEAMGLGRVVVASEIGGPCEIIEDGRSGVLVRPGDVDELAAAIAGLLQDPERRQSIEAEAASRSGRFSIENFALRLEEIVSEVTQLSPANKQ